MNGYLDIKPEVREALEAGRPVVALESTILSHGMPWPENLDFAARVEEVVRAEGAVPATMAIMGGKLKVGLSQADLEDAELAGYADWAKEGVWLLAMSQENYLGSTMNLLWDDAADIQATAATTREEAAALTYSLFSYLGILPA